jgi:hypothetical protein
LSELCGSYSSEFLGFEDYDYWLKVNQCSRIDKLPSDKAFYRYRIHANSLTSTLDSELLVDAQSKLLRDIAIRRARAQNLNIVTSSGFAQEVSGALQEVFEKSGLSVTVEVDEQVQEFELEVFASNTISIKPAYLSDTYPSIGSTWFEASAGDKSFNFSLSEKPSNLLKRARTADYRAVVRTNPKQKVVTFFPNPKGPDVEFSLSKARSLMAENPDTVFVGFCHTKSQRSFCDRLNLLAGIPSNYRIIDISNQADADSIVSLMYVLSSSNAIGFFNTDLLGAGDLLEVKTLSTYAALAGLPLLVFSKLDVVLSDPFLAEQWRGLPTITSDFGGFGDFKSEAGAPYTEYLERCDDWLRSLDTSEWFNRLYYLAFL